MKGADVDEEERPGPAEGAEGAPQDITGTGSVTLRKMGAGAPPEGSGE